MEKFIDNIAQDYFTNRRTIRNFSSKEIPIETLEDIVLRASKAPTCGNMQLYSVVATCDEDKKRRLSELHFNQPATNAPILLTICADLQRMTRWARLSDADVGFDNFLSFTSAFADAVIMAQQITTIAEQKYGLGTCYLGTVTYNAPEISKLLKLPQLVVPVACLAIGYPDGEGEATERLPLNGILHFEEYRDDSDDMFLSIHKAKEEYPANKGYVAENGKRNLAQVFTEIRYPRGMNEEFSTKLKDYLRMQKLF